MPAVLQLVADFAKYVDFHIIYIREAHPIGGWETPDHNEEYGVSYSMPKVIEERQAVAAVQSEVAIRRLADRHSVD